MTKVINSYGQEIDFEAAVNLMDEGIRERVHEDAMLWEQGTDAAVSEQEFFNAYCMRHRATFCEEFAPNDVRGQW